MPFSLTNCHEYALVPSVSFEDPEARRQADGAVGLGGAEPREVLAPGADDELADAVRIRGSVRQLRYETLVDVLVPVQDQLGAVLLERIPERRHGDVIAVARTRRESWVVPERNDARSRRCREIRA